MRFLPALVVLLTGSASAQRLDFVCSNPSLHAGLVLRIRTFTPEDSTRGAVVGPMVRCGDGLLVLGLYPGQDDPEYGVPTAAVHRLWVRDNAGSVGLLAGTILGAVSGGALAAVHTNICFRGNPPASATCHGDIAADALIGGAFGGLLGWVLGQGFPHWKRIIP